MWDDVVVDETVQDYCRVVDELVENCLAPVAPLDEKIRWKDRRVE